MQSAQRYVKDRQGSRFKSQFGGTRVQSQGTRFGRARLKSVERPKLQDRPKSELAKDVEYVKADEKRGG